MQIDATKEQCTRKKNKQQGVQTREQELELRKGKGRVEEEHDRSWPPQRTGIDMN